MVGMTAATIPTPGSPGLCVREMRRHSWTVMCTTLQTPVHSKTEL